MDKPTITCVLLNYKRPEHLKKVITSLKKQKNVELEIVIFDNNPTCDFDVDVHIKSSKNYICQPRWPFMAMSKSEYVMSLDDDMFLKDDDVLEIMVKEHKKYYTPDLIIGPHAKMFNGKSYNGRDFNVNNWNQTDIQADVIKGRCMFMKREYLEQIPMLDTFTCEDIYINSFSTNKIYPKSLYHKFVDLPEGDEGLSSAPKWYEMRSECIKKYFKI